MKVGEMEYTRAHKPIQDNQLHSITGDTDSQTSFVCQTCAIRSDNPKEVEFRDSLTIIYNKSYHTIKMSLIQ